MADQALASSDADESLHGYYFEDLSPGMAASYARTVTETDIVLFAGLSGDLNPIHLNQEFAEQSMFKQRIAHGMLTVGFISAALGMRLPGPGCIYLSQKLNFRAPVKIGDTVTARVTVKTLQPKKHRVVMETVCRVGDTVVVDGEALLLVRSRKKA